MNTIKLNRPKRNLGLHLLTIVVIYFTDSLLFATNSASLFLYGKRFGLIILAIAMLFWDIYKGRTKVPAFLLLFSVSIVISAFLAGRFLNGYSYYTMIALLWFGYLFSKKYSLKEFADVFCKWMRVIAGVSLVAWLLSDVIRSMSFLPTITNTVGAQYKFLFFTNVPVLEHLSRRNLGPFWEPGAYQVYLVVSLYFTLFIRQHKHKVLDAILFTVTAMTTLSGAALIPVLLLLAAYFVEEKSAKGFALVTAVGVLLLVLLNTGIFDEIFSKLSGEAETDSITYRIIGMEGGFLGFIRGPLFGSTPEVNEAIKEELAYKYLNQSYASNTNTFMNYFAYYGVFVGGFMLIQSFNLIRKNSASVLASILAFAAFFLTTSNENMMASLLISTLVFFGWQKKQMSTHVQQSDGEVGRNEP